MDHTTFRFGDLPIELAFLVFKYAAQPTFDQAEKYERKNPYSSVLKLCLVSKSVRRAVLPELLHTILLPESRNVKLFVQALFMQEEYKKANSDLQYQYAPRVRKMWIGSDGSGYLNIRPANLEHALQPSERPLAISLLAPIILAAPSLALSWTSVHVKLLIECLEHAWKFRPATPVDEERPRPPWNTKRLTLSCGAPISPTEWNKFTDTPQGVAFLASICQLSSLTYLDRDYESLPLAKEYCLPEWMHTAPLASFKSLHTVILPYPRIITPVSPSGLNYRGVDMHMEVLTLPATLLRAQTGIPKAIEGFVDVLPGQKGTRSDDTCLWVSGFKVRWYPRVGWERFWACVL
ncbi:hypothetical protein EDD22DRAFT_825715 [Suillus occidentalis]|nr:hypothetical protein EDD22DRAFT_825715 [Suillus occidentalis]